MAKPHVGFNWKLIIHFCIIALLLYAISIAWENLGNAKAKRQAEQQQAAANLAQAQEDARAEARKRAAELAASRTPLPPQNPVEPVTPKPETTAMESLQRLKHALFSGDLSELPEGAEHLDGSDYFLVTKPMTWTQASEFAKQHGGLLAFPSTTTDLSRLVSTMAQGKAIWIGARRGADGKWTLTDGSTWAPAKEPDGSGIHLAVDRHGLLGILGTEERLPFVIRWRDEPQPPDEVIEEVDPGPEYAALTSRARELVVAALGTRDDRLAENTRILAWDLDVWLRSLSKSENSQWSPHVAGIKTSTSNGRVPESFPESSGIALSQKMDGLVRAAAQKQREIDNSFLSDTGNIHRAYLAKIQEAIAQADASGEAPRAKALRKAIDSSAKLDSWLRSLDIDF